MIVADASILIAHLDAADAHHERAEALLEQFASSSLGASVTTLAEVLVEPARRGRAREARATIQDLGVRELGLASDAASRLAALRAETRLRMPDCCVLLAAHDAGASTLLTFDERLARAARTQGLALP